MSLLVTFWKCSTRDVVVSSGLFVVVMFFNFSTALAASSIWSELVPFG